MKVLLLVIDGMADVSHPELAWSTPLQAAGTPALDRLAREGCCALMYPLAPGVCPSSEVAHWSMFGYGSEEFPGRAYFHALAAGLPLREGDALFMLNLVPLEKRREGTLVVDHDEALIADICSRHAEGLRKLAPAGMELFYMGGIEFIAVLKGGSSRLRSTDPFLHHLPVEELRPATGWEEDAATVSTTTTLAAFMASAAGWFEEEAACGDSGLGLIMKWPSRAGRVEPLEERHGMRAAAVVSTPCFQGMGAALAMHVEKVSGREAGEDLEAKLKVAGDLLAADREFVFVHTKHADEAAHSGDPSAKAEVIAAMDGALSSAGAMFDDPELLTVITADHSTPTTRDASIIHGGDPVPALFHGRTVRRDGLESFDEVSAARGGMGQVRGGDLMPLILYLSRRARFYTG
jgi:2,3-bisphosphoglycerate-independent phosphoglycerate mutase